MKKRFTQLSMCCIFSILLLLVFTRELTAQEEAANFSFAVSLNSDQFFGFYPFFQGAYSVNDNVDFTFYGIFWSGGTGGGWGNWTEFGIGASFAAGNGFSINPQLGVLGGNLLSSGAGGPAVFFDGLVPNLTIGLDQDKVEGQIYAGFYAPTRDKVDGLGTTLSFLHYWINAGYKISSLVSAGLHFEHLINTGGSEVEESADVYQWFGPYIQFTKPGGGPYARLSAGGDFLEENDSFFKLTAGFDF
ncbi:MAG: DUF6733 family protein [Bacteroidota bacterium]